MKRTISLILAITALLVVAGCGGTDQPLNDQPTDTGTPSAPDVNTGDEPVQEIDLPVEDIEPDQDLESDDLDEFDAILDDIENI